MPKKIITALDLEMAARLGKKEYIITPEDVLTDVARERAEQLEINIVLPKASTAPPAAKQPGANSTVEEKSIVRENAKTAASLPADALAVFQRELTQLKQEIDRLKTNIAPGETATPAVTVKEPLSTGIGTLNTDAEADLVIKNGHLVIPRLGILRADLKIVGRKIAAISINGQSRGKQTIDATGLYLLPGVMDPHIHLGLFGELADELEKETASALLGGITAAGCFVYSQESYFDYLPKFIEAVEQHSYIDIFPHLVITTPRQVEEIPAYIRDLNITSFKVYMCGVPGLIPHMNDDKILDVFEQVKGYPDVSVCIHAENPHIVERALAQHLEEVKRENTLLAWSKTRPNLAEEEAVKRAILLAKTYGVNIYIVHLSVRESLDVIRAARQNGTDFSLHAETTSPYLTIDTGSELGVRGKMVPPFRSSEDRESLWQGIRDGVIDTLGTDNVTLTLAEKKIELGMAEAIPGYPALATHLPSLLHEGINKNRIDLTRLAELTSLRPAEIFGLHPLKGSLLPGSDADITLVNLQERRRVDPQKLASRADFSLYEGQELTGWPVYTVKSGEVVMQNGALLSTAGKNGMLIRRLAPQ